MMGFSCGRREATVTRRYFCPEGGRTMLRSKKGFTMIEMVVILAVIGVLAAVLAPMITTYVSDARIRRVEADVKAIGSAVLAFNRDMREWPIWAAGSATKPADTKYDVLSSEDGDDAATVDTTITFDTSANLESIDDQLITNDPGYNTTGVRKWRGPYLEGISEDPWGNKYYVTVKYLQPSYLSPGSEKAVFVLSAGPNELIQTNFEQGVNAVTVGGDDIVYRVR